MTIRSDDDINLHIRIL